MDTAEAKAIRAEVKDNTLEQEELRAERISQQKPASEEQQKKIKAARSSTQQELDQAEMGSIVDTYGDYAKKATPCEIKQLILDDNRCKLRPALNLLSTLLLLQNNEHKAAVAYDGKRLSQGLSARVKGSYQAAEAIRQLLALFNTDITQDYKRLDPGADFQDKVQSLLPVLKRVMGIKPQPKTQWVDGELVEVLAVDPIPLLKQVLHALGLKLRKVANQKRVDGVKQARVYMIDPQDLEKKTAMAQAFVQRARDLSKTLETPDLKALPGYRKIGRAPAVNYTMEAAA